MLRATPRLAALGLLLSLSTAACTQRNGFGSGDAEPDASGTDSTVTPEAGPDGARPDVVADVMLRTTDLILEGAPSDAPMRFAGPAGTSAPTWVYPEDRTIVPPNLEGFELHFMPGDGNTLFEVTFQVGAEALRLYAPCTAMGGGCVLPIPQNTFDLVVNLGRPLGGVTMRIRGTAMAGGGSVSTSMNRYLGIAQTDLRGGVYYWASSGNILRYEFGTGRTGVRPEIYERGDVFNCAGCHVLSRDGRRMSVGRGIPGPAATRIFDVEMHTPTSPTLPSNFGSFSPDNRWYLGGDGRSLAVVDGTTGALNSTALAANTLGSQPDWSPTNELAVFSRTRTPPPIAVGMPGHSAPADLMTMRWDGTRFTVPTVLLSSMGENNYYPSISPDGRFVLFNRSAADTYNAPDAALWIMPIDGGAPVHLVAADGHDTLGNSWPKWTPHVEMYMNQEVAEPLYWVTFSSRRSYGLRLQQDGRAADSRTSQLWMAAVRSNGDADPSAPAFWLPFQNLREGNHISQWVETVVRRDCTMDRNCPSDQTCQDGRCAGPPG